MVKEHAIRTRHIAIGMLLGGKTQRNVAIELGADIRTIRRWWASYTLGKSLKNLPGRGRKDSIPRVAKIVISKSVSKRQQSTRKLSKRLKVKGISISHMSVHRYLTNVIGAKSFKRPVKPRLTDKQKANRVSFCKERKYWTVDDWRRILFSDESPFEIFHTPNRQNDRIWAKNNLTLLPQEKIKFPSKLHVWGMMSYCALSDLHIIPVGSTVTAKYYVEEILTKSILPSLKRKRKTGSILVRQLLPNMSNYIFQQDGAPAHHAKVTQEWCKLNLQSFWQKGIWPGNSSDLNPIENLWAILKSRVDEMEMCTNIEMLEKTVKLAWSEISPEILDNLISSMPKRIQKCLELSGDYIGK